MTRVGTPFDTAVEEAIREARAKVVIGFPWWMRLFVWKGVAAITLGRRVYVGPSMLSSPDALTRLLKHELVHVRQAGELGLPRFLWRYAAEYVRLRRSGLGSYEAYRRISFEIEAFAAEEAV